MPKLNVKKRNEPKSEGRKKEREKLRDIYLNLILIIAMPKVNRMDTKTAYSAVPR
jgi:hypothetical protein